MKTKIYISGAISKNPDYKKQFTKKYMELDRANYCVLSPLFINAPDLSYEDFMHIDFSMIDVCDAIYMMNGWRESSGAMRELEYAKQKGLIIMYE